MSWKASGWAKELTSGANGEVITRSEKLVLLVLADYYNEEEREAHPSVGRIAKEAMMSTRRCQELLRALARKGVVVIEERPMAGAPNRSNLYRFPLLGCNARTLGCDVSQGEGAGARTQTVSTTVNHSLSESERAEAPSQESEDSVQLAHPEPVKKVRRGRNEMPPPPPQVFVDRMRLKYAALIDFGVSYEAWENHTSRKKHASQERSLENWLQRDLKFQQERSARGNVQVAHQQGQRRERPLLFPQAVAR